MTNTIKMVVFDLAGTTLNEQNVVYKTLCKAIVNHGIDTNLQLVLKLGAGKEKHQAIKDIVQFSAPDKIRESHLIFKNFKAMLNKAYQKLEVLPVKGVEEVLLKLRKDQIIVVLNTGYDRRIACTLLKKIGWSEKFMYDLLITASDVEKTRPYPDMIKKAMRKFNITDPLKVLKAGDSAVDIEEGKNAKCGITVGVLSGAQSQEQLKSAKPDYIISSLSELYKKVLL
ncbi:MAG: HAD hydrolase-like protein [Tenacibaculum sp.]